ncbi:MAG: hypothetical protein ABR577_14790 [Pyrinomonadaceae bacterium]
MTEMNEQAIRTIVRDELLGIIKDAQESVSLKKDPTGMGKKALEGLADLIRSRQTADKREGQ